MSSARLKSNRTVWGLGRRSLLWLLTGCAVALAAQQDESEDSILRQKSTPASDYAVKDIRGFDVRIHPSLLAESGPHVDLGREALDALDRDLAAVVDRIPGNALDKVRDVPIFLSLADPVTPCACYHLSADWLRSNGFDPKKARAVELANAERYVEWRIQQPSMILHELAHALEDQHLQDARPQITAAYERIQAAGVLDDVLRASGQRDRHYALTNRAEYFAETSEALFGVNDFWPFVRAEVESADPKGATLIDSLWRR